jgi:hypothetical protein
MQTSGVPYSTTSPKRHMSTSQSLDNNVIVFICDGPMFTGSRFLRHRYSIQSHLSQVYRHQANHQVILLDLSQSALSPAFTHVKKHDISDRAITLSTQPALGYWLGKSYERLSGSELNTTYTCLDHKGLFRHPPICGASGVSFRPCGT